MKLLHAFLLLVMVAAAARADGPIARQEDQTVRSNNEQFEAVITVKPAKTTVFDLRGGKREELWSVPVYYRVAYLADDGRHFAAGYPEASLIPVDYAADLVLVEFFNGPKSLKKITAHDIVPDPAELHRTVSHYIWGKYIGFDKEGRFVVETASGHRLTFDADTGHIIKTESVQ